MRFHVTEQIATVVENTYAVEAANEDAAMDALESMETPEKQRAFVHGETIAKQVEIMGAEEASA